MLSTAIIVKIIAALTGAGLCIFDFVCYSKQRLTEKFAFLWAVFGAVIFLCGVVPFLSGWAQVFEFYTALALIAVVLVILFMLFSMSLVISELTRKNQELAMQVSLLNNENEQVLNAVRLLLEKDGREKKVGDEFNWIRKRRYS